MENTETIVIDGTTVILTDYEKVGQGKIIIADDWSGAFTYTWGSMGSGIKEFILSINNGYFANKLTSDDYEFCGKRTATNIRRFIREDMKYELPWYKFMSAQKELREKIREIEGMSDSNEFIHWCSALPDSLMCYDLDYSEEKEFKNDIEGIFNSEPWNFIGKKTTIEYNWLCELHEKLKERINADRSN